MSDMAILETYKDSEKYTNEQLRRIRQIDYQYRHTDEDLQQEAWVGFLESYHSYDPNRGQLDRRVSFVVWFKLLRLLQRENKKHGKTFVQSDLDTGDEDDDPLAMETSRQEFPMVEFLDELSNDGHILVKLVLDTPNDLLALTNSTSGLPTIRRYVRGRLNWTIKRFGDAVTNVRDAMWLTS